MAILRTALFLLLLANLIFFTWTQGYFGGVGNDGREPGRLATQLAPDKIRLPGDGGAEGAGAMPAVPPPVMTSASATFVAVPAPGALLAESRPEPRPHVSLCRAVGVLALDDAVRLKAALARIAPGIAATLKPVSEAQSYWVHIPPLSNRLAAERKSAELKKLGIAEYYVVQDEGPNRYAVSLGLFRSEQAANDFLGVLARKGVGSAKIQVRDKEPDKAGLELRAAAEQFAADPVAELLATSGAALGNCPK